MVVVGLAAMTSGCDEAAATDTDMQRWRADPTARSLCDFEGRRVSVETELSSFMRWSPGVSKILKHQRTTELDENFRWTIVCHGTDTDSPTVQFHTLPDPGMDSRRVHLDLGIDPATSSHTFLITSDQPATDFQFEPVNDENCGASFRLYVTATDGRRWAIRPNPIPSGASGSFMGVVAASEDPADDPYFSLQPM